ncbi:MAG: CopG family transcriptional regulator [Chloroflexota bacterium]
MEFQNITLALPKEMVHRVKLIAVRRRTSISGLLKQTLEEIVQKDERYQKARQQHLILLERGFDLQTGGNISWKRDDLHERQP